MKVKWRRRYHKRDHVATILGLWCNINWNDCSLHWDALIQTITGCYKGGRFRTRVEAQEWCAARAEEVVLGMYHASRKMLKEAKIDPD